MQVLNSAPDMFANRKVRKSYAPGRGSQGGHSGEAPTNHVEGWRSSTACDKWHPRPRAQKKGPAAPPPPVLLSGLPLELCSNACMEAVLEQAGLEGAIVHCEITRGTHRGEARVTLKSWQMAEQCIAHFRGCKWDSACSCVSASFVDAPHTAKVSVPRSKPTQTVWRATDNAKNRHIANVAPSKTEGMQLPIFSKAVHNSCKTKEAGEECAASKEGSIDKPLSPGASPLTSQASTTSGTSPKPTKIGWADIMSDTDDEEISTCADPVWDRNSMGSGEVGTSDEGL